jgi:hypothetical protein
MSPKLKGILNFVAVLGTCVIMWCLGFVAGQAHPQYKVFDFGVKTPIIGSPLTDGKTSPTK